MFEQIIKKRTEWLYDYRGHDCVGYCRFNNGSCFSSDTAIAEKTKENEARRNVTARISAEISNYIGNNGGEIPTEDANTATGFTGGFKVRYIDNAPAGTFDAPGGGSYVYDLYDEGSPEVAENEIRYSEGAICSGEAATNGNGANARNFALLVGLEGGAIFCVDNR
jgi:hypothetical protein